MSVTRTYFVPSLSSDSFHDVDSTSDGRLLCSCPRFQFGKRDTATCRHVEIIRAALHVSERCQELEHDTGSGVCLNCLIAYIAGAAKKVKRDYVKKPPKKVRGRRAADA